MIAIDPNHRKRRVPVPAAWSHCRNDEAESEDGKKRRRRFRYLKIEKSNGKGERCGGRNDQGERKIRSKEAEVSKVKKRGEELPMIDRE